MFPIGGQLADGSDIKARVAFGVAQGFDDGSEAGLRSATRKCIHRNIHGIDTRIAGSQNRARRRTRGVMGVEMDRQPDLLLEGLDQNLGRRRFHQARHVLQAQHMGPRRLQLLAAGDVVFQVILGAVRVQNIAGIADGAFQNLVGLQHRIHRDAHVFHPVQAVKHPEHIDARDRGLFDKALHHIVRVGGVAHAIRAAQKHLGHQVRHLRAQIAEALPGAFLQEAVGHIKGRAPPAFDREQLRQMGGIGGSRLDHVDRPHAGGQQGLVPIAHGGVGDQHLFLRAHPIGDGLRALLFKQIAGAHRRLHTRNGGLRGLDLGGGFGAACGFGVTVHRDIGDIGQDLGRPVAPLFEGEEVGRRVDEFGRIAVIQKGRMFQQVDDELDVRRHAADAEFAQGAVHPRNRLFRRLGMGGHLDEQAVIIARDDAARIGRAAIQPDAVAGGRAVGGQAAIVGDEVVQRVFGGDAALYGMAVQLDLSLRGHPGGLRQGLALFDQDLRLHDVDAGHLFGDGVFHLNAGVHLDEVEFLIVHIHQEFDGARAFILHMGADFPGHFADIGALGFGQIGGRGAFHDLLVAPLHGAVTFPQVPNIALLVAQDLHLDVAGA